MILEDRPIWKDYERRIAAAEGIGARWEEHWDGEYGGRPKVQYLRLKFLKTGSVMLENRDLYRRVWNGKQGIEIDLKARTYKVVAKRPSFDRACLLGISDLTAKYEPGMTRLWTLESRVRFWQAPCIRLRHLRSWPHEPEYIWYFSEKTGLPLGFAEAYSYEFIGSVTSYVNELNLEAKLGPSAFSLVPPVGFRKLE